MVDQQSSVKAIINLPKIYAGAVLLVRPFVVTHHDKHCDMRFQFGESGLKEGLVAITHLRGTNDLTLKT